MFSFTEEGVIVISNSYNYLKIGHSNLRGRSEEVVWHAVTGEDKRFKAKITTYYIKDTSPYNKPENVTVKKFPLLIY